MAFIQKENGKYISETDCPNCGYASTYNLVTDSRDMIHSKTLCYSEY